MAEVNVMEKISSEIDESQIKLIYSTQCIKAQALLTDKLKKQIQHHKETCGYLRSDNSKLQSEIKEASQKLNSMLIAQETIKMANVELKKELLLAIEKKEDMIDRIKIGENRYEGLWAESKKRYETIPFVRELLKANEKAHSIKNDIDKLEEVSLKLIEDIEKKRVACAKTDKKRIIELADFIVNEVPKSMKIIEEKTKLIDKLSNELMEPENKEIGKEKSQEKSDAKLNTDLEVNNGDDILVMPKLELPDLELDLLSEKLDQVLKKASFNNENDEILTETVADLPKTRFEINIFYDVNTKNDLISSYFTKPNYGVNQNENCSKRKLINILQDVQIGKDEVVSIMSKVKPGSLEPVESIGIENANVDTINDTSTASLEKKTKEPIQSEEIEEIDLTTKHDNIIFPPTQFLDVAEVTAEVNMNDVVDDEAENNDKKDSQTALSQPREGTGKTVSFDLSEQIQSKEVSNHDLNENTAVGEAGDKRLDVSAASDDDFANMKEMMLKKRNLDLSPHFVYAKNNKLQKKSDDKIVTSKFFENYETNDNTKYKEHVEREIDKDGPYENCSETAIKLVDKKIVKIDDDDIPSNPKRQKLMELPHSIKPVNGLLFSHGSQTIPDSLDISMNTTGYEDVDFPQYIDTNLLLSPKADVPMTCGSPAPVLSQDAPNFLSGLRKTGFSFFGQLSSEANSDTNAANQGTSSGFSFNFGGEEKKTRGGLFSMFK